MSVQVWTCGLNYEERITRFYVSAMELKPFHQRTPQKLAFSKFHPYPNLQRRSSSARRLQHETEPDQPSTSFTTCMSVSLLPSDPALSSPNAPSQNITPPKFACAPFTLCSRPRSPFASTYPLPAPGHAGTPMYSLGLLTPFPVLMKSAVSAARSPDQAARELRKEVPDARLQDGLL